MKFIRFLQEKKGIIIVIFIFLAIVFLLLFLLLTSTARPQITDPSTKVSPLQKTILGQTSDESVSQLPDIENIVTLPNGNIEYQFTSNLTIRPNTIVTDKKNAIFERQLAPVDPDESGYALISEYISKFGQPEREIQGSRFYDWVAHTYIYASQGFTFVGNPNTDEVFEFHFFTPMTTQEYIRQFGEDINEGAQPEELNPE